jgi:hypothetical protein
MKKAVRVVLLASFAFAIAFICFYFVRQRAENLAASLPVASRSLDIASGSVAGEGDRGQTRTAARAKINPEYNEVFLDALDVNLDDDEDLEQVVVAKPAAESSAESPTANRLSVIIADFLPLAGNYRRIWKGETLAVKPKAFVIQPKDLLGDGKIELLCFGIDEANRQTLTVFRPSDSAGTRYKTIFSKSGLSIQVTEPQEAGLSGRPATIQVYEEAKDSASPLDQLRRNFTWSSWAEAYRPEAVTVIPGERVEKNYIDKIVTGSAVDFEAYLNGLWERESQDDGETVLLSFQTSRREITISGNPDVQVWDWEDSSPAFAGIKSSISNDAVPDMLRLLSVDLVGVDRIRVSAHAQQLARFSPREDWDGTYRRFAGAASTKNQDGFSPLLAEAALGSLTDPEGRKYNFYARDFEGSYQGSGYCLELKGGIYRFKERSGSRRGRYYFFAYRDYLVLDLDPYEETAEPAGRMTFILLVQGGPGGSVGGMKLKSARVSSGAVLPLYKPDIELEHSAVQGAK